MKTLIDEFADIKIMRFEVPGWEDLELRQKQFAYHLAEAAKIGRDITWDQYCAWNLTVRHLVEDILEKYDGDRNCQEFNDFLVYAKRLFFSSGMHHHYAEDKFFPPCPKEYFRSLAVASGCQEGIDELLDVIYSPDIFPVRRSGSKDGDIVALSSVNFYDGVTRAEVEEYYKALENPEDPRPVSHGLNTKVVKEGGKVVEKPWKSGGIYGEAIDRIAEELEKAVESAENETQRKALGLLIDYYKTGDLKKWDDFNVVWTGETSGKVDYINGFIEDYDDPLGRKATWEGYVNIKDEEASARTEKLSAAAQWFEDHSPIDPRFRKPHVKGVSAKVVTAVALGGATYPSTPIGINLPNADWIRREFGSKSVTISNITKAYDKAALETPRSALKEFAFCQEEVDAYKKYGSIVDEVHTDLHECLGHGSGQLLPGVSPNALGEYQSTLEEARADLFGLYYIADPKLVELGILPDQEAWKCSYSGYIRNGLLTQLARIEPGKKVTEAHMQNRKLIAQWCYEKGRASNVIERKVVDGKTFFTVNDFLALRDLFAALLAEVQRIKSEGDYAAGKSLVEDYGVEIDHDLHAEVRERYYSLGLKPYGGFVNPDIAPVVEGGEIVDYKIVPIDDYLAQQLEYGKKYRTL
ncbi:MAG: dihydrofolate reductase [Bacteroidales bacterium]|nr:dihydrofolate reductase [Bacteroidales bacterium]